MNIVLIRHGATPGNLLGQYIGCRTDEPLCEKGKEDLIHFSYPPVTQIFASPMLRCLQTAKLIYPGIIPRIIPDFRECDFGDFEGKNYADLCGDPRYQAWIDSCGTLPFPGGESRAEVTSRTLAVFHSLLPVLLRQPSAIIAHGGTIMSIMEHYARPSRDYFDFQVRNGKGYNLDLTGGHFVQIPEC